MTKKMKGILLVNMGGPSNTHEIKGYLKSIFSDPAILPVPGFVRNSLAKYISRKRAPKVAERYNMIGGKSPLPEWTERQRQLITSSLNSSYNNLKISHAFRYSSPTIEQAVNVMSENKVDELILFPLFPHRTNAMTGSIEKEADRVCRKRNIKLKSVPAWENREEILEIWRDYIRAELERISGDCHLLFVAHGIPLRDVRRGDDYPEKVKETAAALGTDLPGNVSWTLAFQSKVGPVGWTEPYLEDELLRISKLSKNLLIMPLSFVSDCLETLYDLDIVAMKMANEAGFEEVRRIRVFNDDPRFAEALAKIALEVL
jgi:ferrochelatase